MTSGQHLLIAVNIRLDRVGGQANLVRVPQFGTELPDRPVAGKAPLAQPTHHIPAQDPPRHSDRGLGFWTERLGMGRAGACGAMRQLTDQVQGPVEREHSMMAMVTRGQRPAARPAPPLLDSQFDACELRVFRPAVWHDDPLLVYDVLGNQHTISRPLWVLAFCRTIDFLTSVPCDGVRFAQAVRQHWGIENSLHWVLDVSFDEDACRIRKDKGAQTFSVLRHIALNLLRRESSHKRGIKARRKRAGWDRGYLLRVLTG